MRKADENRAKKFIKNHERYKKWVAFAICLSLITGTGTLYMMNKPATALTEAGAESVGVVLETADSDYEQELIEETLENDENDASEDASNESSEETSGDTSSEESAAEGEESDDEDSAGEDSAKDEDPAKEDGAADKESTEESAEGSEKSGEEKEDADADKKDGDSASKESGASDEDDVKADEKSGEDKDASDGDTEDKDSASRDKSDAEESGEKDEDETEDVASKKSSLKEDEEETEADEAGEKAPGKDKKEAEEESNKEKKTASSLGLSTVTREATDEEKLESLDVPKSVKVEDYVTEIIYERKLGNDKWEKIEKEDILEGDWIRVTYVYDIPKEATFADDITLDMADTTDIIDVEKVSVLDDAGDAELTDDGLISISFNDDTKQEILDKIELEVSEVVDKDGNVLTEDEIEALESEDSEDESKDSEKDTDKDESDAATESSDKDALNLQSRAFGLGGVVSLFQQGAISVLSVFEPLTVYAEEGDEGTQTNRLRVEGPAKGSNSESNAVTVELKPEWIKSVSARKNVSEEWENSVFQGYDENSGEPLNSGDAINDGDVVFFKLDFAIPAGTLAEENSGKPKLITNTVVYHISDQLPLFPAGDNYNPMICDIIWESKKVKVGTLTIKEGIATFEFIREYAENNYNADIDTSFYFAGSASKDSADENDEITYNFNDKLTFKVVVREKNKFKHTTEKECSEIYDNNKVNYTIKIKSDAENGSGGNITLTDTFSFAGDTNETQWYFGEARQLFNSSLQIKEIKVSKNNNDITPIEESYTNDGFRIVLPELKKDEEYLVTYKYEFDKNLYNLSANPTVKNTAVAKTDAYGSSSDSAEFTIKGNKEEKNPHIRKEFVSIDKDNKNVTWRIIISNPNGVNLNGYTLKDIIKTKNKDNEDILTDYEGEATIQPSIIVNGTSTTTIMLDGDNGFVFPDTNGSYTITVQTPYKEYELNNKKLYNSASITDENYEWHTDPIPSGEIETEIDTDQKVDKAVEEYTLKDGNYVVKWKVKAIKDIEMSVEDDDGKQCWIYLDEMSDGQIITEDELSKLTESLKNELGSNNVRLEKGSKVKLTDRDIYGYKWFNIYFYTKVSEGFEYEYETVASLKNGNDKLDVVNKAYVYSKTFGGSEDSIEYSPMLSKFDGNMKTVGTYNYNDEYLEGDGILTWIVKLTMPSDNRANYGTLTIKEQLPDSVTALSEESGGLAISTTENMTNAVLFKNGCAKIAGNLFFYDSNSHEIMFDGDTIKGQTLYFRIKARINEDQIDNRTWVGLNGATKKSFENKVVLIDQTKKEIQWASETTDVILDGEIIKKSQLTLNDSETKRQEVEYELEINKSGEDLLQGGDVLTLKDTLCSKYGDDKFAVVLLENNIQVLEIDSQGNTKELDKDEYSIAISESEIVESGYNYGTSFVKYNNIEFKIPDKKHLLIKYTYMFYIVAPLAFASKYWRIQVNNTAILEGIAHTNNSDQTETEIKIYRIGATTEVVGVDFAKVDSADISKLLPGGKFSLWVYSNDLTQSTVDSYGDSGFTEVYLQKKSDNVYAPVNSGSNTFIATEGKCSFTNIQTGILYRIVEEEQPAGYKKGDPIYFLVQKNADDAKIMPENFGKKVKVYNIGERVTFTNVKDETTSITVKKEWVNDDGTKSPISFKISRRKSHIASTYNYYSVNVYYKNQSAQNEVVSYKGYPSVREGSVLHYNVPYYQWQTTAVTINGETEEKTAQGSSFIENKEILVNGDLNIMIYAKNGIVTDYELQVSIDLSDHQDESNVLQGDTDIESLSDTYQLTDENRWKITIDNLPKSYVEKKDGVKYDWLYYVTEVSRNGYYDVSYSDNNINGTNSGTIVITNTRNHVEGYELPRTGGIGEEPIKAAGLGFMGFAFVGSGVYFYKRRRKKAS